MINCGKCGWSNPDYAAFCTNCGSAVGKQASGTASGDSWRFGAKDTTGTPDALDPVALAESVSSEAETNAEPEMPETPGEAELVESESPAEALESGESPEHAADRLAGVSNPNETDASARKGVGVRNARTLIDLTVPDFRAMVGRPDEDPDADAIETDSGSMNSPGIPEALAETETGLKAISPPGRGSSESEQTPDNSETANAEATPPDPSNGGAAFKAAGSMLNKANVQTMDLDIQDVSDVDEQETPRRGRSLQDLGSLDVTIERFDGRSDVEERLGDSLSESQSTLLSSVDMSPMGSTVDPHGLDIGVPPPIPKASGYILRSVSGGEQPPITLRETGIVIGREGDVSIGSDEFLSPRHASVSYDEDGIWVEDLASLNGVWLQGRGALQLDVGEEIRIGQQVLRLEHADRGEGLTATDNEGTRRLGSKRNLSTLRLAQLGSDGVPVAIFNIPRYGCKIGRRMADFVVADDNAVSTTHAFIAPLENSRLEVRDLSTGNGCWLRARGRQKLTEGDVVMMGRTVWRVARLSQG
jgi:pSer/pThr/pTyr-binding forkhead associated (FHA) protein